jgi:DNA mismatch repair protein MutS
MYAIVTARRLYSSLANHKQSHTALLKDVYKLQKENSQHLVLIRVGDFYEFYGHQAVIASNLLDIALGSKVYQVNKNSTKQQSGQSSSEDKSFNLEFTGFPVRSLSSYLPKILQKGLSVAVCEQYEGEMESDTKFYRKVARIVTPATYIEDFEAIHDEHTINDSGTIVALYPPQNLGENKMGVAWWNVASGEISNATMFLSDIQSFLAKIQPEDIVVPEYCKAKESIIDDNIRQAALNSGVSYRLIYNTCFFNISNAMPLNEIASSALVSYVKYLNGGTLPSLLSVPKNWNFTSTMKMDPQTINGLEIFRAIRPYQQLHYIKDVSSFESAKSSSKHFGSLFWALNHCVTASGSRLLKRWLGMKLRIFIVHTLFDSVFSVSFYGHWRSE